MKKYIVHDLQGCGLMDYSFDEPLTANEIRAIRWCDYNNFREPEDRMKWSNFTLNFIADLWEIDFEVVA
jgi:hypothetical protein